MFVLAAIAVFLLLFLFWVDLLGICRRFYRRWMLLKQIPMPEYLPYHWLLGHLPTLRHLNEENVMKNVSEINKPCNKDNSILKVSLGLFYMVSIMDSKFVGRILKEPKPKMIYNILRPWLGRGLLLEEGEKWYRNRHLLTPAFHYEVLKGYVPIYNSCVSLLLDKWSSADQKGEPILLFTTLSSMTLDILLQCAFTLKSNCQTTKVKHPYLDAIYQLMYLCTDRLMNPLYLTKWLYWITPNGRKMKQMCKCVHRYSEKVIAERKAALSQNDKEKKHEGSTEENCKSSRNLDFLDILLVARDEEGKRMSDLEIRNEVDTFMFEGHDTTASAMSWTLYLLAQHPQHQDKVREEIRYILMGRKYLDYDDLEHLNYTMWCIKEAMRLYPPVFGFCRVTTKEIEVGRYVIPKDTIVCIETLVIHRNGNIWENPMEYDPLRFHPSNMEKHGPYDYIPFSAGNRNCIGQVFAMNEMKVVIGMIVNHFFLKVDENHHVEMVPRIVLRTKNDIKLCVEDANDI